MSKSRVPFIHKDVLALLLTVFLSALVLFSRDSSQINYLKFKALRIVNSIAYPIKWYSNIFSINEENKLLKQKLIQFNLMNAELASYHFENIRLKEMLNFVEDQSLNYLTANIIGHHFGLSSQSIMIDIGSESGINKNLTVMDENGLLGKTIKIGERYSSVQLITDKNFRVSIRVGKERALGLFIPTHGKYGILEGVRKSMDLKEGEIAYTSGVSEIYPANIPVARVISISYNNNNPFQHIVVELIGEIDNLDYAFIVL